MAQLVTSQRVYIYILWSYYLVQVWPFEGSLSGPSLLKKPLFVKNTIKIEEKRYGTEKNAHLSAVLSLNAEEMLEREEE